MVKPLDERARDKKPLVRSGVATDEKCPLELLELLSNDPEDMVRGDVATNESASDSILRKLSKDPDDSVRCAVASNNSTPLDVLEVLLADKSAYVRQNAKDNPNSKKISSDKKSSGATAKKVVAVKKSNSKAKPVKGEFSSQEVTASVFSYTPAEFKKIKLKTELKIWREDLDDNSSSYPTYIGSPFDENNLNLETEIEDSEFDKDLIYVIPHYFYESASYEIEGAIDFHWTIILPPIIGLLFPSKPMDFAQKGEHQIKFELQDASDRTEPEITFYIGSRQITSCLLDDVDTEVLKEVISAL